MKEELRAAINEKNEIYGNFLMFIFRNYEVQVLF
jgi:hypothetical protein